MKRFGIVCPPVSGHIHPMAALGRELVSRGHQVTIFQLPDLEQKVHSEELEFRPVGAAEFPRGSLATWLSDLARLKGLAALQFTIRAVTRTTIAMCRDLPGAAREARLDGLIVDQMEPAGGAVAEYLGLPFVTIANALAINRDLSVPPPFTSWRYRDVAWARIRNRLGYAISDRITSPIFQAVQSARRGWKLPTLQSNEDSYSSLAQICQMPQAFDFPRRCLPPHFHYVGPIRRGRVATTPFPWDRLDGRPVIYASLGTLQNSREPVFRCFAEACKGLHAQLVISHGGGLDERAAASLPGRPLVVPYAPQTEVLTRGALTLTHAGLNTVLDSLACGVPLVAVPITYEQPAIARRVEWCGAGRTISFSELRPARLRREVEEVLGNSRYTKAAGCLREAIAAGGGVRHAAEVVLSALS